MQIGSIQHAEAGAADLSIGPLQRAGVPPEIVAPSARARLFEWARSPKPPSGLWQPIKRPLHHRHSRVYGSGNGGRGAVGEKVGDPHHFARSVVIG